MKQRQIKTTLKKLAGAAQMLAEQDIEVSRAQAVWLLEGCMVVLHKLGFSLLEIERAWRTNKKEEQERKIDRKRENPLEVEKLEKTEKPLTMHQLGRLLSQGHTLFIGACSLRREISDQGTYSVFAGNTRYPCENLPMALVTLTIVAGTVETHKHKENT